MNLILITPPTTDELSSLVLFFKNLEAQHTIQYVQYVKTETDIEKPWNLSLQQAIEAVASSDTTDWIVFVGTHPHAGLLWAMKTYPKLKYLWINTSSTSAPHPRDKYFNNIFYADAPNYLDQLHHSIF